MARKIIILLMALHFHNALIGMNPALHLQPFPLELSKNIVSFINPQPQWWYLHQTFKHNANVFAICFDPLDQFLATKSDGGITRIFELKTNTKIASFKTDAMVKSEIFSPSGEYLTVASNGKADIHSIQTNTKISSFQPRCWFNSIADPSNKLLAIALNNTANIFDTETNIVNRTQNTPIASFKHNDTVNSVNFDSSSKFLVTASSDGLVRIFDLQTHTEIAFLNHDCVVNSARFDASDNRIATASMDEMARIFVRHNDYTYEQLLLKNALLTWLLIEKPDKQIDSLEKLFNAIKWEQLELKNALLTWLLLIQESDKQINTLEKLLDETQYNISYDEAVRIWSTFPATMQSAIKRTMLYKIQKYGKTTSWLTNSWSF